MESEITPITHRKIQRQQRVPRQGQNSSIPFIRGIARGFPRDEQIVRIVTPEEEQADQSLAVIARRHALRGQGRVEQSQRAERG